MGPFSVVHRNHLGDPVVIENAPFLDDGTPMPTRYWLIGSKETYRIKVTNQGSAKDTNIDIVCTIPPEQTYVSSSGPTTATVKGNVLTFAPLPTLAPKAVATFKVITKGAKAGDSRFRVEMTTDVTTSPVMETESTHIYSDE